jgi:hypothetical protein
MSKSHVQSCNWVFCKNYTLVCSASDLSISEGVQLHTGGRHSSDEQNCQQGKSDWLYSSGHQTKCPGFWGRIKLTLNPNHICMTFCSLKFYRYVYHFDTSGCFCGGTNKGKSSFLCTATIKRCQLLFLGTMIHLPTNTVYKFWTPTLTTTTLINSATSINMRLHSTALSCFLRLLIHEWIQSHGCWPDVDQFHHKRVSVTMP